MYTYANASMDWYGTDLPEIRFPLSWNGQMYTGMVPEDKWRYLKTRGFRKVISEESPAPGFRVVRFGIVNVDGETCRLTVAEAVNIAEEQAASEAAQAAALAQARADKINNFKLSNLEVLEFDYRLRNKNIPAQYQVSKAEAVDIVRQVVDGEA